MYVCVFLCAQHLQPSAMVEKALVRLAMVAMEMVECGGGGGDEGEARVREIWSQLANKLVFFYFLQLINITSLINRLREKVARLKGDRHALPAVTLAALLKPLPQGPGLAHVVSAALCHQHSAGKTPSAAAAAGEWPPSSPDTLHFPPRPLSHHSHLSLSLSLRSRLQVPLPVSCNVNLCPF